MQIRDLIGFTKFIFAGALPLAGVGVVVTNVLISTSAFHGKQIRWSVIVANLCLSLLLIVVGTKLAAESSRQHLRLIGFWMWLASLILGVVLAMRFLVVLFDFMIGERAVEWGVEAGIAIVGVAITAAAFTLFRRMIRAFPGKD
jgi:hypothetical protein